MKNWKSPFDTNHQTLAGLQTLSSIHWKTVFSNYIKFLFLLLFSSQILVAQVEDGKVIKDVYSGKDNVSLVHAHGPILVKKSPDDKVYIESEISVKAKNRENLDIVLEHFNIDASGLGNRLEISTAFKTQSWNTTNNSTTIKFKDGTRARGIKDLIVSTTLLIPDLSELKLKNKYGDINIDTEVPGDLSVVLFSGKLETSSLCRNLDLSMKYSKGFLQNAGDAKMELFDSDLIIGDLFTAEIKSKYSEVEMKNVAGDLIVQTFDDKWKVGHVKGVFKFNDKYSEFEFKTLENAEGSIFDGEIISDSVNKLYLKNSKYSKYKIGNINDFSSSVSFDDHLEIEKVNSVTADNSKYSEYMIQELGHSFISNEAFDDKISLEKVSSKFETIHAEGKYIKINLHIEDGAQFLVDVDLQHGKFDHPEFDVQIHKETNNNLELKGYVGGQKKDSSNRLTIKGFDNVVYWK